MSGASLQTAYGVDYSSACCTIVRARKRGRAIHFETMAAARPVNDPAVKTLVATIAAEQQKGRASLALAAPAQDSVLRCLETPFTSAAKARAVLPSLLDVQLPFPLEQCSSCYIVPEQSRSSGIRATAVALPTERLAELLARQKADGFDADIMDHEAIALWRYAASCDASPERLVLYLGDDRTVAVAGSGGEPCASFSARTAWRMDGDAAARDKLVVRLRQFMAGAFTQLNGKTPVVLACGPLARHGATLIPQSLDMAPENCRLMENPESALARSVAAAALVIDDWSVNLRTGEHEHPIQQQRRDQSTQRFHAAIRSAAILAIAISLGSVALLEQRHTALQSRVQAAAGELTGAAVIPRGQEQFIAEQFVSGAADRFRPFRQWLEPTAYPLFAAMLTQARESGQKLDTLSVRADAMVIRGSGTDWIDPERLAETARKQGWKVEIERADAGLDERVHYTVRASR